jgi:hypothetical protein
MERQMERQIIGGMHHMLEYLAGVRPACAKKEDERTRADVSLPDEPVAGEGEVSPELKLHA